MAVFVSSRGKRWLLDGGDIVLPVESPVPRRLALAEVGDEELKCDWACGTEPLRAAGPPTAALSLEPAWGGGFKGELTDDENN